MTNDQINAIAIAAIAAVEAAKAAEDAAKEAYRQLVINGATPETLAAGRQVVYSATKAKIAAQNAPEVDY
jgi:hypothetical protein